MEDSTHCLGVIVLLLIAKCEAKNDKSFGDGLVSNHNTYDYDNYPDIGLEDHTTPDTNQDTVYSNIGPRDHTTSDANQYTVHSNIGPEDHTRRYTKKSSVHSNVGLGDHKTPDTNQDTVYSYIGPGNHTTPDTNQASVHSNVGPGEHMTPATVDEKKSGSRALYIITPAPTFKVTISVSNENNHTAVLMCDARNVNGAITFSPWLHVWEGRVIRDGLQGRNHDHGNLLIINNLSLRDMGTYICSATFGVKRSETTYTASGYLTVTGLPTILVEKNIFSGEIGQTINISIPFYSNPAVDRFYVLVNGTILPNTSEVTIDIVDKSVDYLMYDKTIKLGAQVVQIVILNLSPRHLDSYTIVLSNSLGHKDFPFQLCLYENKRHSSALYGRMVAAAIALFIGFISVIVIVILVNRYSKGRQSREQSKPGKDNIAVNILYILASNLNGNDECLRGKRTVGSLCSGISGQQLGDDSWTGCKDVFLEKKNEHVTI